MKRFINFSSIRLAALGAVSAIALAACGGGAETTPNPVTNGPTAGPTYAGPAPATADIQAFRINFWENVRGTNRCGNCHNAGGQAPNFARADDVNLAYQQALTVVNRDAPSQSTIVAKVGGGHNCWLADSGACASILTGWIQSWVGTTSGGGTQIQLVAPPVKNVGSSRRFDPNVVPPGYTNVHNLLTQYCANCHTTTAATSQSPYFAVSNISESFKAAIPKMNLDDPINSRFVIRLGRESHNCWSNCAANAEEMRAAIASMQADIAPTIIDPSLVLSQAVTLFDGTVASGGSRYDANVIAKYEFKTMKGTTAFDTSGVDPSADLQFSGTDVTWVGGWGINIKSGKAQASTTGSRKFHQLITATGEYSLEAWVVPGNVTQEDARIITYSGSKTARNFTLAQTMYNYEASNRSTTTDANGAPMLTTDPDDERLQASLQHVVVTFDPVNGRRIYVNGEFTGDMDPKDGGTLGDWDNSFAFALGNEVSNDRQWQGVVRFAAIHNRALSLAQIQQNFKAGVGEKFFLLFGIEQITGISKSYIMFESAQYDSESYLFNKPTFVSLDATAKPGNLTIKGMRIGINGAEPHVGQSYRLLDKTIADADYTSGAGALISSIGTIIGLEQGPEFDEFFLCFDQLGTRTSVCSNYASPSPVIDTTPVTRLSDIGVRTFDEINATMSAVTGVSPNNAKVKPTFDSVRQSLPATKDLQSYLASHQTAVAQLAIQYCSALIDDTTARGNYFPGFNFGSNLASDGDRDLLVDPVINRVIGNAKSQPSQAAVKTELKALIGRLCTTTACGGSRTIDVAKAVCGSAVGSAATMVQ
jgi:hypothetical protein